LEALIEAKLRAQKPDWLTRHSQDAPVLRRLTLPITEAPRLLRLLAQDDISGQVLFPGFDGAVRGLKEKMFWDTPE
jgi:hypothetical protein